MFLILSSKLLIMRMFVHPPESEISSSLLATLKEMGDLALMVSVMLFLASRDPGRNVAIIDAVSVGLCILAITPVVSLYTLDVERLYPVYLIWGRSFALAGLLWLVVEFVKRRREGCNCVPARQTGDSLTSRSLAYRRFSFFAAACRERIFRNARELTLQGTPNDQLHVS